MFERFSGDLIEWFNDERLKISDRLFRIWFDYNEHDVCEFYFITQIIKVDDRYLLGLQSFNVNDDKFKDNHLRFVYLDEIRNLEYYEDDLEEGE